MKKIDRADFFRCPNVKRMSRESLFGFFTFFGYQSRTDFQNFYYKKSTETPYVFTTFQFETLDNLVAKPQIKFLLKQSH